MRTQWVVLADANRARIFARVGGGGWQDIQDLKRGAAPGDGNGREVRLPPGMRKLNNVEALPGAPDGFVDRLARELKAARKRGDFDALTLVAPPDVLDALTAQLDPATRRTLTGTISEDLVGLPLKEARRALARRL